MTATTQKATGLTATPCAFSKANCLPTSAYETDVGVLFVSRETNPSGITAFTVRRQMVDGDIKTVGEFHHFPTAADARAQIKRLHLGTTL